MCWQHTSSANEVPWKHKAQSTQWSRHLCDTNLSAASKLRRTCIVVCHDRGIVLKAMAYGGRVVTTMSSVQH